MDDVIEGGGYLPIGQFPEQGWGFSSPSFDNMLLSIYSDPDPYNLDSGGAPAEQIWWEIAADGEEPAMTLDDFPANAAALGTEAAVTSPAAEVCVDDGRRKRSWAAAGDLSEAAPDKAAQRKQRKTTKNRESAARCRERKQAYTMGLESLVAQLEEENAKLLKEEAEWNKERYKQLMENLIPVTGHRKPSSRITRVHSMEW